MPKDKHSPVIILPNQKDIDAFTPVVSPADSEDPKAILSAFDAIAERSLIFPVNYENLPFIKEFLLSQERLLQEYYVAEDWLYDNAVEADEEIHTNDKNKDVKKKAEERYVSAVRLFEENAEQIFQTVRSSTDLWKRLRAAYTKVHVALETYLTQNGVQDVGGHYSKEFMTKISRLHDVIGDNPSGLGSKYNEKMLDIIKNYPNYPVLTPVGRSAEKNFMLKDEKGNNFFAQDNVPGTKLSAAELYGLQSNMVKEYDGDVVADFTLSERDLSLFKRFLDQDSKVGFGLPHLLDAWKDQQSVHYASREARRNEEAWKELYKLMIEERQFVAGQKDNALAAAMKKVPPLASLRKSARITMGMRQTMQGRDNEHENNERPIRSYREGVMLRGARATLRNPAYNSDEYNEATLLPARGAAIGGRSFAGFDPSTSPSGEDIVGSRVGADKRTKATNLVDAFLHGNGKADKKKKDKHGKADKERDKHGKADKKRDEHRREPRSSSHFTVVDNSDEIVVDNSELYNMRRNESRSSSPLTVFDNSELYNTQKGVGVYSVAGPVPKSPVALRSSKGHGDYEEVRHKSPVASRISNPYDAPWDQSMFGKVLDKNLRGDKKHNDRRELPASHQSQGRLSPVAFHGSKGHGDYEEVEPASHQSQGRLSPVAFHSRGHGDYEEVEPASHRSQGRLSSGSEPYATTSTFAGKPRSQSHDDTSMGEPVYSQVVKNKAMGEPVYSQVVKNKAMGEPVYSQVVKNKAMGEPVYSQVVKNKGGARSAFSIKESVDSDDVPPDVPPRGYEGMYANMSLPPVPPRSPSPSRAQESSHVTSKPAMPPRPAPKPAMPPRPQPKTDGRGGYNR